MQARKLESMVFCCKNADGWRGGTTSMQFCDFEAIRRGQEAGMVDFPAVRTPLGREGTSSMQFCDFDPIRGGQDIGLFCQNAGG